MILENITIGLGITGSFCNFEKLEGVINSLKAEGANIIPIASYNTLNETNRFSNPKIIKEKIVTLCESEIIDTISKAEPIGPKGMMDILLVLPCTGNTIAKLSHGIADTTVTMSVKSHLRNNKPVVIALSTNDALSGNASNIGILLNRKNYFFVPFAQDEPDKKPNSLVFNKYKVLETVKSALNEKQIQPIIS